MQRMVFFLLLFLLLLCAGGVDPVLANKFETISGGVNGIDREKIELLKAVSRYTGLFLLFLALLSWITRYRFEGFVVYAKGSGNTTVRKGASILIFLSLIFIGLSFL